MPNIQNKNRSNNTRIQNVGTISPHKLLKQVSSIINFIFSMMRYYIFVSKIHVIWIIVCCKFLMANNHNAILDNKQYKE